jgi:hypothetical protein
MNRKWWSSIVLLAGGAGLLTPGGCARNQHLVSIAVTPQGATITQSPGVVVGTQFTAIGTYVHPPETRDITKIATWSVDSPVILQVSPTTPGLINTTGNGCGTNLGVSARVYTDNGNPNGNVLIGTATMSVTFGNGSSCP